jgi:hypothetical protein
MFKVIFAAGLEAAGKLEAFASHTIQDAVIIPRKGDSLVLRTADRGSLHPAALTIDEVSTLASMDGFFVALRVLGDFDSADPLFLRVRRIRQELSALGWTLLTPARPLDPAVDVDEYEGLESY